MGKRFVMQDTLWAGTESSLGAFLSSSEAVAEKLALSPYPDDEDENEDCMPDLLQVQNGVGILSIRGPLTNNDSPWNSYFGITSYNAIREALMYAAGDESIEAILLDVNSGGGAVNGVDDTAKLISMIDKNVKPVVAYTDGAMCSAAYWLGCSAREVYASNVAVVGSIGVISTHMEQSKALKDAGVGVTVMRAGKYKALANSVEPLTKEAKDQMQSQLDAVYSIFLGHVATCRGKSADYADANMAQGREFIGQQALGASLVDGIESFDTLMSMMNKRFIGKAGQDNCATLMQQGTPMKMKQAMTEQELAALAAGISVEAATDAEGSAEVVAKVEESVDAETVDVSAETASHESALVTYLQGEVKAKNESLLEAQIKVRDIETKLAGVEATHNGLLEIVKHSVGNMQIALGGSALDLSAMDAVAVLNEHKRISADFKNKFKAGGVAAVDTIEPVKNEQVAVNALTHARLTAVRFSK